MAVPRRAPALSLPTITLSPALVRHGVFGLKAIAGVLAGATVALAVMTYDTRPVAVPAPAPVTPAAELFPPGNVTIVYRRLAAPKIAARLEATKITARLEETEQLELAGEGIDPAQASYYERPVHTVSYVNPEPARARSIFEVTRAAISTVLTKVGAFVALRPKESTDLEAPIPPRPRSGSIMNEVDDYLWEVYQRLPVKKDGTGDFTWKDPAAARRMGLALQDYVIGGMDPEFREQLYHAGKAMDAAGLQWSMLSAFRDDYRQRLASGFKASVGNSLHGGSRRTGGYGHGRAIDIAAADEGTMEQVWHWIDAHGAKYGLNRPMPGADPAHIQQRGDYNRIAMNLREARVGSATPVAANRAPDGRAVAEVQVADPPHWRRHKEGRRRVASASR